MRDPTVKHVKAQGTLHSFNELADTYPDGIFISMLAFKDINVRDNSVDIGAGVIY